MDNISDSPLLISRKPQRGTLAEIAALVAPLHARGLRQPLALRSAASGLCMRHACAVARAEQAPLRVRLQYRSSPRKEAWRLREEWPSMGGALTTLSDSPQGSRVEGQGSDYDNTPNHAEPDDSGQGPVSVPRTGVRLGEGAIPELGDPEECEADPALPSTEDVISKTEQITKNIQELLRAAQENRHDSFVPCSERIYQAVTEMATLFPKRPSSETVRGSLRLLTSSAGRLQGECHRATPPDSCPADTQLVTQQLIQCAYDIAKAAKQLVTVTTKESD